VARRCACSRKWKNSSRNSEARANPGFGKNAFTPELQRAPPVRLDVVRIVVVVGQKLRGSCVLSAHGMTPTMGLDVFVLALVLLQTLLGHCLLLPKGIGGICRFSY
jgi:hypothetical protein